MLMPSFPHLKRVLCYSPCGRNGGNSAANSGILLRFFDFLSARAFSSVQKRKIQNQCELRTGPVLGLLNGHGFTAKQIAKITKSFPFVFSSDEEVLSQRLGFLRSILCSDDDLTRVVTANPNLLAASLNNRLIPNHKYIKSFLGSDELVVKTVKRSSRILLVDVGKNLGAKVSFLRESGVPHSSVAKLLERCPGLLIRTSYKLEKLVEKAISLGFKPSDPMIVSAIRAIGQNKTSTWDRKIEVYKKWGWSKDDFVSAFKKQPHCVCLSEKKINEGMDVFVNRMGLSSSDIARYPSILFYSMEKRIIPRYSVLAVLLSKGILGLRPSGISTYCNGLAISEKAFVERFVNRYPEHVLELWKKLQGKTAV